MHSFKSRDELKAIIAPFVKVRLNPKRDKNGYFVERAITIDVHQLSSTYHDADVRRVDAQGVQVFFYSGCTTIAWADLIGVTVHGAASQTFWLARQMEMAA